MHCQLVLKSLVSNQAILVNKDGQEFIWPADQLPAGSQPGAVFSCALINPTGLDETDHNLAKAILNELLKLS